MATALGTHLVFDVHGSSAKLDQRLDGTRYVEGGGAKTGIRIHQQRQITDIGNAAYVGEDVVQGGNTQIRQTQGAGSNTATGQVNGLEAGTLGQQSMVGVDRTDHLQRTFFGYGVTE